MKKIVFFVFLFFIFIWNAFANIQITWEEENIKNLVSVENGVVVIQGDIIISDYTQIDYDLKVLGDVEIQTHVKLLKDLEVEGNLEIWDYSQSYGKITAKNILTNNSFRWDILQADNIVLWGNNSVVGGFYTTENFEAGSNFLSKWACLTCWVGRKAGTPSSGPSKMRQPRHSTIFVTLCSGKSVRDFPIGKNLRAHPH